jgi:hypothetical protein
MATAGIKKIRGGWNVIEKPVAPEPAIEEVAAPLGPEAAGLLLNCNELIELHDKVLGRAKWAGFSEGKFDLSQDGRQKLLEAVLGDSPVNVENVRNLHTALSKRDQLGWNLGSLPIFTIAEEWLAERDVVTTPEKLDDGFIRDFINPEVALARVSVAGFTPDSPTIRDPERILQIALGDILLDAKSVDQLWLSLGYAFIERWNRELPPLARKVQTSICHYANPRQIQIHTPAIFGFADDLAYRS